MFKCNENDLGHFYEHQSLYIFFAKKTASLSALKQNYPGISFCSLHQFHSDQVVGAKAGGDELKADAHFTYDRNLALIIKTADCVPLFFYCPVTDTILGVHAGWRGLQQEIIRKSLEKAFPYSDRKTLITWIGPHIHTEFYEFEKSDADLLAAVAPPLYYEIIGDADKVRLNLRAIVDHQLKSCGVDPSRVTHLNIDTYSSDQHYSYRRGKEKDQSLYHFIVNRRG